MITRRTKVQLLVFVLITLLGVTFVGARYARLDRVFFDDAYTVVAHYPESGGIFAGALNRIVIGGFPLGYYIAAQGALIVFVIEIAIYARLMNKKDLEFGIREEA